MPLGANLSGSYDHRMVALSVVIAVLASYAALDLGGRVTASRGRARFLWLLGGSVAMGTGIWSMHYIGMLAYSLPVPIYYDWPMVSVSLLAAMLASAVALFVVSRSAMTVRSACTGGLLMGLGIAAMHYIGMEAMRLPAMCHYSAPLVGLSVVLAVVISLVALWLTFRLRSETRSTGWRKLASASIMGAAIPVMHYTGMAAATFMPTNLAVDLTHSVEVSSLGLVGIGSVTLMVLLLAILTSLVDRRFSAQASELERSEQSYRQLVDSVQVILWRGNLDCSRFNYVNQEAEDLLGYPVGQWTTTPGFWMDHLDPQDRELVASHCQTAAASLAPQQKCEPSPRQCEPSPRQFEHSPRQFEHRMIAADGTVIWLRTSVRLIASNGESNELVGVMTDITERKHAQEAAEQASQAKSEFLAEIERLNRQLLRENTRMSSELEITQRLQKMILPRGEEMRQIAGLDVSGFMQSAAQVGGDYYDTVSKDGGVFFGIGDVTGHGLESGVIAIMVQTAVRTLLAGGQYERNNFFDVLNRVIYDNVRRMNCDRSLTFSLLHYQDSLLTISGQHEEVLVVRNDGVLETHDTLDLGFPLGLVEDISPFVGEVTVPLHPGDVMVVYTDGITEGVNSNGVAFGLERLSEAVRTNHRQPAEAIREAVLSSFRTYIGVQHLLDDISLLVVKPD